MAGGQELDPGVKEQGVGAGVKREFPYIVVPVSKFSGQYTYFQRPKIEREALRRGVDPGEVIQELFELMNS